MEQNKVTFSSIYVIKLVLKKTKLIICLALIAAIIGGGLSILLGLKDLSYGNTVDFYLTKTDSSQTLLPLLQSESFAEKLLLDEYGLPEELVGTQDYENAKKQVISLNEARKNLADTVKVREKIRTSLTTPKDAAGNVISSWTVIEQTYTSLKNNYDSIYNLLSTYKNANTEGVVTDQHKQETQRLEAMVNSARAELEQYTASAYDPARREISLIEDQYAIYSAAVSTQILETEEAVEAVVSKWRPNADVQKKVSDISKALTIVYATPSESVREVLEKQAKPASGETPEINTSFIKVDVNVVGDEELANFIIERLKIRLPGFVELNIERLSHTTNVTCTLISPARTAERIENDHGLTEVVLFAAVAAVMTVIVTCAVIILKEWIKANEPKSEANEKKENE